MQLQFFSPSLLPVSNRPAYLDKTCFERASFFHSNNQTTTSHKISHHNVLLKKTKTNKLCIQMLVIFPGVRIFLWKVDLSYALTKTIEYSSVIII